MIKTLAGSIRQYKKQTIMSPVTVALEVFFEIMIPLIMAKLIDEGIDQGDMGVIWKYGLILLAVAMISIIKYRSFPLPILISFRLPVLSHV